MTAIGDLIAPAMLVVLVAGVIAGLLGRGADWLALASVVLFGLSLVFPKPGEAEHSAAMGLHPFPVSLLMLILTLLAMTLAAVIGYAARKVIAAVRTAGGRSRMGQERFKTRMQEGRP